MTQLCRILEWDSQFFACRIARVEAQAFTRQNIEEILGWASEQRVECLYFLCPPDNSESVIMAEERGFHLVDIRVELNWQATEVSDHSPENIDSIRLFEPKDSEELRQIASNIYTDTRFYYDQQFSRSQVSALYSTWLTQHCEDPSNKVFVAADSNGVGGFIACRFDSSQVGRISLLGVKTDAQGKGYGRKLVTAAQRYFLNEAASEICVVTQGRNIAAQRLYQAQGFRTKNLNLWYHKWFK